MIQERRSSSTRRRSAARRSFSQGKTAEHLRTVPDCQGIVGMILFEPGKALGKAGVPNSLCDRFNLVKLGRFTNLYLAGEDFYARKDGEAVGNDEAVEDVHAGHHGPEAAENILSFGKAFAVEEVHPLDKRSMKEVGERLGWADVTARNIPLTSEELVKKMGLSPKKAKKAAGDSIPHIFGIKVDWKDAPSENLLIVAHRIR